LGGSDFFIDAHPRFWGYLINKVMQFFVGNFLRDVTADLGWVRIS
jgi:hypothetical protein